MQNIEQECHNLTAGQNSASAQTINTIKGHISSERFFREYVRKRKPVLIRGGAANWPACQNWDMDYLRNLPVDRLLKVKQADIEKGETEEMKLSDYITLLREFEKSVDVARIQPPYLHDVGLFNVIPELVEDVGTDELKRYLPEFYHKHWWKYVQFFVSIKGHITPLHFDTLITHNLFFQIKGKKRLILIPWNQRSGCYMHKWRWARVNPIDPDLEKFAKYAEVTPLKVDIEGGDILFMPSGTLHHVESISFSVSFNIDWHSKGSVIQGLEGIFKGAPRKNTVYNFLMFLAIWCKVPEKYIWPYYKAYLSYIS